MCYWSDSRITNCTVVCGVYIRVWPALILIQNTIVADLTPLSRVGRSQLPQ